MTDTPNRSAAANSRRAFRLRVAGDLTVAPALHRRSPAAVAELVSCDMKLHSVLFGWTRVLTKPCVCPQVLQGSVRLTGGGREAATVRGVEPSGQCSKPGSLKPGAN